MGIRSLGLGWGLPLVLLTFHGHPTMARWLFEVSTARAAEQQLGSSSARQLPALQQISTTEMPNARTEPQPSSPEALTSTATMTLPSRSLVVAGGVSLGSYQAGFVYYLTNSLRAGNNAKPYDVVTGTSAGATNAVLAALAGCNASIGDVPEDSLFYKTWIPVDIKELWAPDKITKSSLFDSAPLEAAISRVRSAVAQSSWKDCNVQLGIVTTRSKARDIALKDGKPLVVARHSEKFMLSLETSGNTLNISNATWLKPEEWPLFPKLGAQEAKVSYDDFFTLLRASAAFPFAFKSVPVSHQLFDPKLQRWVGQTSEFVDGGVYENLPVRLAWRLQNARQDTPNTKHVSTDNAEFIVLDTDSEGWSRRSNSQTKQPESGNLLPTVGRFGADFMRSARTLELLGLLEDDPSLRNQASSMLRVPMVRTATASGQFANFLGFFDEDFRVFDFYLGMLDARAFVMQEGIGKQWQVANHDRRPNGVFSCFMDFDSATHAFTRTIENLPPSCAVLSSPDSTTQANNLIALLRSSLAFKLWTESDTYNSSSIAQLDK